MCVVLVVAVGNFPQHRHSGLQAKGAVSGFVPANSTELLGKPNAIPVKVGAYFDNLHDLSLQNRRFVGEGFYWFAWPQELQDKLEQLKIDSSTMVAIANQLDTWDIDIQGLDDEPMRLADGSYYRQMRFSAHLYMPEISLKRFPFETLQLPIVLEVYDDNLAIENENMVLLPDARSNALVAPTAGINGYHIMDSSLYPTLRTLGSDWGLSNGRLSYSGVTLSVAFGRSSLPSILRYFLPLFIVVGIVLLAPSLEGELGDMRLAIPSTGLLTLIFLQQSYQAEIPQLDYLTFLDWFYACGYLISIGTFVLFLWGTNFYQRAPQDAKDQALTVINRTDVAFQLSAVLITILIGLLAWFV